jgi:hypothetical protein
VGWVGWVECPEVVAEVGTLVKRLLENIWLFVRYTSYTGGSYDESGGCLILGLCDGIRNSRAMDIKWYGNDMNEPSVGIYLSIGICETVGRRLCSLPWDICNIQPL